MKKLPVINTVIGALALIVTVYLLVSHLKEKKAQAELEEEAKLIGDPIAING